MAKIIPIDVIKGISGKYGNKSSDYFATNRSSNQIHLTKIINPYQGPPTEKQKAQQAKFAARQVVSTALLNANRPSETTGEKGTADYQLVQRMKRQMGLSNINQVLHKYMGEDNVIRLPHGDEFQPPPTQDGGGLGRRHEAAHHHPHLGQPRPGHGLGRRRPTTRRPGHDPRHAEDGLRLRQVERRQHAVRTHPDRQRRPHPHGLLQDGQHGRRAPTRAEIPTRVAAEPSATNLPPPGLRPHESRPGDLLPPQAAHNDYSSFSSTIQKKSFPIMSANKKETLSLSSRRPSPSSRPSPPAWASRVASQPSERPTLPTRVNHPKRLNHPTAARLATRPNLPARPNRYRAGPLTPP